MLCTYVGLILFYDFPYSVSQRLLCAFRRLNARFARDRFSVNAQSPQQSAAYRQILLCQKSLHVFLAKAKLAANTVGRKLPTIDQTANSNHLDVEPSGDIFRI